ncbi:MAG TPA: FixH family protein [Ferruginibacter sp.]|nr:FixH family protein [Ferruginibacter sp.]HMP21205.1 FixH family protein [Ferruginibacter sp.]
MNWGIKILIAYLAFVAGIAVLVIKSSQQNIDLVTTDYYAKELKYQERIDAISRTKALLTSVQYKAVEGKLHLVFPAAFSGKTISGTIVLYCPSDKRKDVESGFVTDSSRAAISLPAAGGAYDLQVSWQDSDVAYYFEEKVFL